ncbi:hypothetical protein L6452_20740 [Arctium lappa]|uniref:Uncharacterized protein n=1 Tax=Arctium lappa TaxID=4217 RepID=A0ACB9BD11_ARCLA|nr:hypothetical protein L6452_20740 [Arctium lappa]
MGISSKGFTVEVIENVVLKELNFYNLDESIEGKLMPKKLRGVCAIQVTELKCGGIVIGIMFDHRVADGYSANMFNSSWADMARSETPSMFKKSILNPRNPTTYSSSMNSNLFDGNRVIGTKVPVHGQDGLWVR